MHYLYLFLAIILETISTTLLKYSNGFRELAPTAASLSFYAASFYFLSLCMQHLPVGVVYAIWSGIGIILITLFAYIVHKETLDLPSIIGIVLIVSGVVVMKVFSKL